MAAAADDDVLTWGALAVGPLFTLLVIVAVVTTVATSPLMGLVKPDPWLDEGDVH